MLLNGKCSWSYKSFKEVKSGNDIEQSAVEIQSAKSKNSPGTAHFEWDNEEPKSPANSPKAKGAAKNNSFSSSSASPLISAVESHYDYDEIDHKNKTKAGKNKIVKRKNTATKKRGCSETKSPKIQTKSKKLKLKNIESDEEQSDCSDEGLVFQTRYSDNTLKVAEIANSIDSDNIDIQTELKETNFDFTTSPLVVKLRNKEETSDMKTGKGRFSKQENSEKDILKENKNDFLDETFSDFASIGTKKENSHCGNENTESSNFNLEISSDVDFEAEMSDRCYKLSSEIHSMYDMLQKTLFQSDNYEEKNVLTADTTEAKENEETKQNNARNRSRNKVSDKNKKDDVKKIHTKTNCDAEVNSNNSLFEKSSLISNGSEKLDYNELDFDVNFEDSNDLSLEWDNSDLKVSDSKKTSFQPDSCEKKNDSKADATETRNNTKSKENKVRSSYRKIVPEKNKKINVKKNLIKPKRDSEVCLDNSLFGKSSVISNESAKVDQNNKLDFDSINLEDSNDSSFNNLDLKLNDSKKNLFQFESREEKNNSKAYAIEAKESVKTKENKTKNNYRNKVSGENKTANVNKIHIKSNRDSGVNFNNSLFEKSSVINNESEKLDQNKLDFDSINLEDSNDLSFDWDNSDLKLSDSKKTKNRNKEETNKKPLINKTRSRSCGNKKITDSPLKNLSLIQVKENGYASGNPISKGKNRYKNSQILDLTKNANNDSGFVNEFDKNNSTMKHFLDNANKNKKNLNEDRKSNSEKSKPLTWEELELKLLSNAENSEPEMSPINYNSSSMCDFGFTKVEDDKVESFLGPKKCTSQQVGKDIVWKSDLKKPPKAYATCVKNMFGNKNTLGPLEMNQISTVDTSPNMHIIQKTISAMERITAAYYPLPTFQTFTKSEELNVQGTEYSFSMHSTIICTAGNRLGITKEANINDARKSNADQDDTLNLECSNSILDNDFLNESSISESTQNSAKLIGKKLNSSRSLSAKPLEKKSYPLRSKKELKNKVEEKTNVKKAKNKPSVVKNKSNSTENPSSFVSKRKNSLKTGLRTNASKKKDISEVLNSSNSSDEQSNCFQDDESNEMKEEKNIYSVIYEKNEHSDLRRSNENNSRATTKPSIFSGNKDLKQSIDPTPVKHQSKASKKYQNYLKKLFQADDLSTGKHPEDDTEREHSALEEDLFSLSSEDSESDDCSGSETLQSSFFANVLDEEEKLS